MARGDFLDAQIVARILASDLALTIIYPPLRVPAPAPAVGAPVSPLTGPKPSSTLVPAPTAPAKPPKAMKCLWLDTTVASAGGDSSRIERLKQSGVGLVEGAVALARVLVADAALDPSNPFGKTAFDGCDVVEFYGRRYRVLRVDRIGRSFAKPVTYAVWLAGSQVE